MQDSQSPTPAPFVVAMEAWQKANKRMMTASESMNFRRAWEALSAERRAAAAARGELSVPEMPALEARTFGSSWKPPPSEPARRTG